jgi:isoleucyl-tRNA synthetase
MDEYKITEAAKLMMAYIQDLSTWYIRRVKDLLDSHRLESVEVLRATLRFFSAYTASILPFSTERLWSAIRETNHNFADPESVHLTNILTARFEPTQKQQALLKDMETLRELCSQILAVRKDKKLRVRQPLYADLDKINFENSLIETLTLECNLINKSLNNLEGEIFEASGEFGSIKVDLVVGSELAVLGFGRDTERQIQNWRKKQGFKPGEVINIFWALEKTENRDIYEEVVKAMDWEKLNLEVKFVDASEIGDGSESLEIKEFAKIKLKANI